LHLHTVTSPTTLFTPTLTMVGQVLHTVALSWLYLPEVVDVPQLVHTPVPPVQLQYVPLLHEQL
jgi:hypothetical protein